MRSLQVEKAPGGAGSDATGLMLCYRLIGDLSALTWPAPGEALEPVRLWAHTCAEAFVAPRDGTGAYREFNFSPSGQFAIFDFAAYRQAGPALAARRVGGIETHREAERFELMVQIPWEALPGAGPWLVGLSMVIEGREGQFAYWALRHAEGQPDFHSPAGFVLGWDTPKKKQAMS